MKDYLFPFFILLLGFSPWLGAQETCGDQEALKFVQLSQPLAKATLVYSREIPTMIEDMKNNFKDCYPQDNPETKAEVILDHVSQSPEFILAVYQGKVVGQILCQTKNEENVAGGYIQKFCVDKSQRGLGIGGKLMDECLKYHQQHQMSSTLWVVPENTRAIKFYEARGFKVTGKGFDFEDYLIMEKSYLR